jgi:hypothetical protein
MGINDFLKSDPRTKGLISSLQESFSKNSGSASFTSFVLKQKLFTEDDYLAWAQRTYELPILKPDFFHMHNPEAQIWNNWKNFYSWKPDLIPLAEWDGVLFVGCVEKPEQWKSNSPVCFVLSSPSYLENWYAKYNSQAAAEAVPEEVSGTHEFELKDDESLEGTQADAGEAPADSEALEGFENFTSSVVPISKKSEADPAVDFFGSQPSLPKLEKTATGVVLKPAAVAPAASASPPVPPPIPPRANTVTGMTASGVTRIQPKADIPAFEIKTPTAAIKGVHHLKEYLFKYPTFAEQLRVICEPIKHHYKKFMLISIDEKGEEISPMFWSDLFHPPKNNSNYRLDIQTPCIFSIVSRTVKPFHGPVSTNDVNEKFFEDWNQSEIPEQVTIVPVALKTHFIGMLLAVGEKSAYNNQALKFAEKISEEIVHKLELTQTKKKAA